MKLELYYPAKPYDIHQKWGIFNPAYLQFDGRLKNKILGVDYKIDYINQQVLVLVNNQWVILTDAFCKHNGIDLGIGSDGKLTAPVRMRIYRQDYFPEGGGYQVEAITTEKWEVGGQECYILLGFAHNKQFLHQLGDVLEVGDEIAIPDNTGFSTGPHTHFSCYRLDDNFQVMDKNDANGSFDQSSYYNGFCAEDAGFVVSTLKTIISLYEKVVNLSKK